MVYKRRNALRSKRPVGLRKVGRKRPYSTKPALAVRKYVQRAISSNSETKIKSLPYTLSTFNSGINATSDLIKVLPQLGLGTDSSSRIGNKIQPIKLVIRGFIIYDTTTTAAFTPARMLGARLFCFSDKSNRAYQNGVSNYNLLEEGDSTSGEWTGQTIQYSRPHNTDQFKWYADKKMKILKPYGLTSSSGVGSTPLACMDSSMYHPFTITLTKKHLPAHLQYDTTDSTVYPVNFAPLIALGYCDLLGASPDTSSSQLAMQFESVLYYKDC